MQQHLTLEDHLQAEADRLLFPRSVSAPSNSGQSVVSLGVGSSEEQNTKNGFGGRCRRNKVSSVEWNEKDYGCVHVQTCCKKPRF